MDINGAVPAFSLLKLGSPENRDFHFCDIGDIFGHVAKDEIYK
jgi:hypothetical protein